MQQRSFGGTPSLICLPCAIIILLVCNSELFNAKQFSLMKQSKCMTLWKRSHSLSFACEAKSMRPIKTRSRVPHSPPRTLAGVPVTRRTFLFSGELHRACSPRISLKAHIRQNGDWWCVPGADAQQQRQRRSQCGIRGGFPREQRGRGRWL